MAEKSNPYTAPQERSPAGPSEETAKGEPSSRERANRIVGLSCYAMAVVMLGLIAFGIYDTVATRGAAALKDSLGNLSLFAAAALVFLAIGYTTGRR